MTLFHEKLQNFKIFTFLLLSSDVLLTSVGYLWTYLSVRWKNVVGIVQAVKKSSFMPFNLVKK